MEIQSKRGILTPNAERKKLRPGCLDLPGNSGGTRLHSIYLKKTTDQKRTKVSNQGRWFVTLNWFGLYFAPLSPASPGESGS